MNSESPWSWWSLYWLVWLLAFVVPELIAIRRPGPMDTLSEQVWKLLDHHSFGRFTGWMLAAFLIWAAVHFLSRGRWA